MSDRKRYTKPTMAILIDAAGTKRPTADDIPTVAQAIWFNDVKVYDPSGQLIDFWCVDEVINLLCGPADAWSLTPGNGNHNTASDEAQ